MLETNFVRSTLCELHYRSFINFLSLKKFYPAAFVDNLVRPSRKQDQEKRKTTANLPYLFAEEQRKKTKELTRSNRENVSRRRCTERICTDIVLRSVTILRVHERLSFLLSG